LEKFEKNQNFSLPYIPQKWIKTIFMVQKKQLLRKKKEKVVVPFKQIRCGHPITLTNNGMPTMFGEV
jgi:hypothetical protein